MPMQPLSTTHWFLHHDGFMKGVIPRKFCWINPAGIWCKNDVILTLMRRDDVASTLIRRHFRTKCPLGKSCNQYNLFFFLLKSCSINEEVKSTSLVGFGVSFFFLFFFFFFFLSFTLQAGSGERQRILLHTIMCPSNTRQSLQIQRTGVPVQT